MTLEKLFTIADIAQMTGLTDRTIRNYIKNGQLTGKKIGVQWRFAEEDIRRLFSQASVNEAMSAQTDSYIKKFADNTSDVLAACIIIDIPAPDDSAIENIARFAANLVGTYSGNISTRFDFRQRTDSDTWRFTAQGDIAVISKLLEEVKKYACAL